MLGRAIWVSHLALTFVLAPACLLATSHQPAFHARRQLQAHHQYPANLTTSRGGGAHNTPSYSTEELYSMTRDFLESFEWPNNQKQANAINSTIFTDNVLGRVDATRNFVGRELNTEYIYGLFAGIRDNPNPDFFTLLGWPEQYQLAHWAGVGNVVSFSVINYLLTPSTNVTVPFEVDVWLTFNDLYQISQYDASFRYLQWSLDSMTQRSMAALGITNATMFQGMIAQKLATSICSIAQGSCNGTNQQYGSNEECIEFLTTETRYGQAYELGMNTLLCRMVHQTMAPLAPDVHCSHIGKTGGAYCVDDRDYAQVVTESYFNITSFIGAGLPGNGQM